MPVFQYRAKRDTFFSMRLCKQGTEHTFDTDVVGTPPHHFEPLDGGPVGKCRDASIFKRQDERDAAKRRAAEETQEPATYNEAARATSAQVAEPSNPTPAATGKLPAVPDGDGAFDTVMALDKPTLLAMAKRDGKSTHGSKADIARRLLNLNVE